MKKHTSGPWEIVGPTMGVYSTRGKYYVAYTCTISPAPVGAITGATIASAEQLANAHLIASAPLLLDACKEALELLKGPLLEEKLVRVYHQISDAVNKAEGL